jgi:hypothetical protein
VSSGLGSLDPIPPHPVLAFLGRDRQPEPLLQRVAYGAPHSVSLPAGSLGQLVDRGAPVARQEREQRRLLGAGAGLGEGSVDGFLALRGRCHPDRLVAVMADPVNATGEAHHQRTAEHPVDDTLSYTRRTRLDVP